MLAALNIVLLKYFQKKKCEGSKKKYITIDIEFMTMAVVDAGVVKLEP